MEVVIYSTIATAPGQVTVICNDDQTVDSLISAFCTERGIRHQNEYVLRNIKHELLPNIRKIRTCGIQNGDIMYLGVRDLTLGTRIQHPRDIQEIYPMGGYVINVCPLVNVQVQSERWLGGCNQWWLLGGVALLIGAVGLIAVSLLKVNGNTIPTDYGVVIDAGSSHTQVFVYKWNGDKHNNTAIAKQVFTQKAKGGGISSYAADPAKAGASLTEILDGAKSIVPNSNQAKTPLFLGATAGMRLLEAANKTQSDAIMKSVRATMSTYPFVFSEPEKQSVILPGKDEGAFGWITVNYLLEKFGESNMLKYLFSGQSSDVVGALDLGGASTQLTFLPEKPSALPAESCSKLLLYGKTYNIYSHSYLCYGLNEMRRRYNAHLVLQAQNDNKTLLDPCRPKGYNFTLPFSEVFEVPCTKSQRSLVPINVLTNTSYTFVGTSNATECLTDVKTLFNFTAKCENEPCSFNGVHQPSVTGNYVAFSGFYYTVSYFNLSGSFDLEVFRERYQEFCDKSWSEVKDRNTYGETEVQIPHDVLASKICLEAMYIDTLLTNGYKFDKNSWHSINFREKVHETELGWSLGFMLNVSNIIPAEQPVPTVSTPVFIILVFIFASFIALAVAFAIYAMSLNKTASLKYEKLTTYGSV